MIRETESDRWNKVFDSMMKEQEENNNYETMMEANKFFDSFSFPKYAIVDEDEIAEFIEFAEKRGAIYKKCPETGYYKLQENKYCKSDWMRNSQNKGPRRKFII